MAKRILLFAILFSALLFIAVNAKSPIKVQGDGVFYYSYLHSVLFDHDLNFKNELEHYSSYDAGSRWFLEHHTLTPIGKTPNAYAYGLAIMWLPFILIAQTLTWLFGLMKPNFFVLDGYSYFYNLAINFSGWLFGILALIINYKTAKKFFAENVAAWTVVALLLATPWIYYQIFEPSMSHMASLLMVSVFVYFLTDLYVGKKINYWLLMLVTFLMLAIRWQNLLFCLAFVPLLIREFKEKKYRDIISQKTALVVSIVIFWLSQFWLWHNLYGSYFLTPQGKNFIKPEFHGLYVLFSTNHGLLLWSPVLILAIGGWYYLGKKHKYLPIMALMVFVAQWLINGSLNDLGGGDAFGGRRFIEIMPFFALGLAAVWGKIKKYYWIFATIVVILIGWNFLLIENYRLGTIPHAGEFAFFRQNYFKVISIDYSRYINRLNN
ncbi:MAG: hypothetical protein WC516_01530 [Patescibacteria group bacterium]